MHFAFAGVKAELVSCQGVSILQLLLQLTQNGSKLRCILAFEGPDDGHYSMRVTTISRIKRPYQGQREREYKSMPSC